MSTITLKQTIYLENELQECRGFAGKLWVRSGHTKMKTVLYCTFILLVVHMMLFVKYMQLTRDIYCIIDENAFNLSISSVLLCQFIINSSNALCFVNHSTPISIPYPVQSPNTFTQHSRPWVQNSAAKVAFIYTQSTACLTANCTLVPSPHSSHHHITEQKKQTNKKPPCI